MNTHSSVNEIEIPFSRNNPQRRKIDNGVFHTISGLHLISKWELQNEKKLYKIKFHFLLFVLLQDKKSFVFSRFSCQDTQNYVKRPEEILKEYPDGC